MTENGVEVTRYYCVIMRVMLCDMCACAQNVATTSFELRWSLYGSAVWTSSSSIWTDAAQLIVKSIDLFSRWQFSLVHFVVMCFTDLVRRSCVASFSFQLIDRNRRMCGRCIERKTEKETHKKIDDQDYVCARSLCASRSCENLTIYDSCFYCRFFGLFTHFTDCCETLVDCPIALRYSIQHLIKRYTLDRCHRWSLL